ncbi:MAG: AraC family transcriptional regulator [Clostridia bacterium]|nr:AraC family transcriptional regulator [Clostridia bacterium]MBO5316750.1 AraC family transcriptional regulator [Clostridia bacterium]
MFYQRKADEERHLYFKRYTKTNYPGYDPLPHFHGSVEIFIVERGSYTIYTGGNETVLKEGDIAFIDRFTPHTSGVTELCENLSVYVVVASSKYFSSVDWLHEFTLNSFVSRSAGFDKILEVVKSVYSLSEELDENAKCGFVTLLLGLLHSYMGERPRRNEKQSEMLIKIMRYIGESYAEDITLDSLSAKFGYEKTYISSTLNKAINMNLREYINRLRISEVKREVAKNPEEPLYIIAERCGYTSQNTFYRALKRYGEEQKHNF